MVVPHGVADASRLRLLSISARDARPCDAAAANRPPTCLSPPACRPPAVQWNIERGYQLAGIIEELRSIDADIISLQEVDVGCERSGGADTGGWTVWCLQRSLPALPHAEAAPLSDRVFSLCVLLPPCCSPPKPTHLLPGLPGPPPALPCCLLPHMPCSLLRLSCAPHPHPQEWPSRRPLG